MSIGALKTCVAIPPRDVYDPRRSGERVEGAMGWDLRLVIGKDSFLAKDTDEQNMGGDYKFFKNGKLVVEMYAPMGSYDPNVNLWSIGGKPVWELGGMQPVIVVDGVNFNEEYQLEGSYFPYDINGKLIYIAKQNGRFHIVYDGHAIGQEFETISMRYCCGSIGVEYGHGQYWFFGTRDGRQYIVLIHR